MHAPPLKRLVVEGQPLMHQRLKSRRHFLRRTATLQGSNFDLLCAWSNIWEETAKLTKLTVPRNTKALARKVSVRLHCLLRWS